MINNKLKKINFPKFLKPRYKYKLIRIGKNHDGGYLVDKQSIKNTKTFISLGINDDWSFEKDFYKINKSVDIKCYDNNTSLIFLVKIFLKKLIFFVYFGVNETLKSFFNIIDYLFFLKSKISNKHISYNDLIKLTKKLESPFFLKIDIEGSEYRILQDILKLKNKISGMVIEFHDVDLFSDKIKKFIKKSDLKLIHIHANNYGLEWNEANIIELTFSKKPKILGKNVYFPNELDQPNVKRNKEIKINFK
tara:strand:- start:609 stop:1355 length:747 start_codon:yes stop_codon:yes gene_type:complete